MIKKKNETDQQPPKERRRFLKKVAYAAPTLIVLGQLGKPTKAAAGYGSPPSDAGFSQ